MVILAEKWPVDLSTMELVVLRVFFVWIVKFDSALTESNTTNDAMNIHEALQKKKC